VYFLHQKATLHNPSSLKRERLWRALPRSSNTFAKTFARHPITLHEPKSACFARRPLWGAASRSSLLEGRSVPAVLACLPRVFAPTCTKLSWPTNLPKFYFILNTISSLFGCGNESSTTRELRPQKELGKEKLLWLASAVLRRKEREHVRSFDRNEGNLHFLALWCGVCGVVLRLQSPQDPRPQMARSVCISCLLTNFGCLKFSKSWRPYEQDDRNAIRGAHGSTSSRGLLPSANAPKFVESLPLTTSTQAQLV